MLGRWRDRSTFRVDRSAAPDAQPSRREAIALLATLILVAGAVTAASYLIRPEKARAFDLFHGSIFLSDQNSPVAVDLATGKPTLRLLGADKQVGIHGSQPMDVVPLLDHTLLLNEATGEFNMVDNSGFIVKHDGGGVPLVTRSGTTSSFGVAADDGQAYIVRTGATGGTDVYLVSQPTVESAIGATGSVRPRASGSMHERGSTAPGGAASANGELWLLVGGTTNGGLRTIRRLSVPPDSSEGATLASANEGRVDGPAAIASATLTGDGSASEVVGVASSSRIDLFAPGARRVIEAYAVPAGVDEILPTTGDQTRLAFLLHGSTGWYIVSVGADGHDLRVPVLLPGVPSSASLAEPAVSNGRLYTIDKQTGRLYEITYDGDAQLVPGRNSYPLATLGSKAIEPSDFGDAYVVSRGPRVIFNSPSHANALMLFTDGSEAPRTIVKSTAVTVNAAAGAEALTHSDVPPGQPGGSPKGTPHPQPVEPINNKIDCRTANQKPHIPVITSAVPGSRSVALSWSYPLIDVQDCVPSTYSVSVALISNDAPAPPASVQVQSQTGLNLTGLFPSTQYAITVTAYINGQSTGSLPVRIVTGPEGPPAPTDLSVTATDTGTWQLSWDSCGTVQQGCVASQSWTITPTVCDGRGLSAPPAPITVTADPTSRHQPPTTYPADDSLLGRGLRFQVQGTGLEGNAGTPSVSSPCVYSWTPPVLADLSVAASAPPQTAGSQATTTTTATVSFANGQVHDLGGVGGTLTYELLSDTTVVDKVGPTTKSSVTLQGILAAQQYRVAVLATPPRHPEAAATIGPVDVVPAVSVWPHVTLAAPIFDAPPGLSGTLHLSFSFPSGTDTRRETFDLVNSQLVCGNTAMDLNRDGVAPGDDMTFNVDRSVYNGPCTATVQLAQDPATATSPPLYGVGNSESATSGPFQIDPPSITSTASDFQAQWAGTNGHPTIVVSYHGNDDLAGASNWHIAVSNGASDCGSADGDPPPATIDVDKSCISAGGTFSVSVDYTYFVVSHAHFDVPVSGDAPTPVNPSKVDFTAAWNADPALPQVEITYTGSEPPDVLAPLDWTETVTSSVSPGAVCGSSNGNPGTSTVAITVDLTTCPPTSGTGTPAVYTVDISFTDPNYGRTGDYPRTVQGTPPQ